MYAKWNEQTGKPYKYKQNLMKWRIHRSIILRQEPKTKIAHKTKQSLSLVRVGGKGESFTNTGQGKDEWMAPTSHTSCMETLLGTNETTTTDVLTSSNEEEQMRSSDDFETTPPYDL